MKIRIKGNIIRYRLTRPEVERFAADGAVKEETNFNNRVLSYTLQRTDKSHLHAEYVQDTITLYMPSVMADEWTGTDRVGFESEYGTLHLFVEKDFKCLDNVAEDQGDNYPNPLAVHNHEQD